MPDLTIPCFTNMVPDTILLIHGVEDQRGEGFGDDHEGFAAGDDAIGALEAGFSMVSGPCAGAAGFEPGEPVPQEFAAVFAEICQQYVADGPAHGDNILAHFGGQAVKGDVGASAGKEATTGLAGERHVANQDLAAPGGLQPWQVFFQSCEIVGFNVHRDRFTKMRPQHMGDGAVGDEEDPGEGGQGIGLDGFEVGRSLVLGDEEIAEGMEVVVAGLFAHGLRFLRNSNAGLCRLLSGRSQIRTPAQAEDTTRAGKTETLS